MTIKLSLAKFFGRLTKTRVPQATLEAAPLSVDELLGFAKPRPVSTPRPAPPQKVLASQSSTSTEVLTAWAMRELAHWRARPADPDRTAESFRKFGESDPNVFIYDFAAGDVQLHEKPEAAGAHEVTLARARKYQNFFRDVARSLPPDFVTPIAMCVSDKLEFVPDVPVLCFQKRRGSTTILAPDPDFLDFNFYESDQEADTIPFEDKMDGAIFVGGTTGGDVTPEIARTCSLPRLRAARFFQNSTRVEFRLPQIVQTTNPEAHAILESLPFCRPGRVSWKEQLMRRCLISIDGNGATCSRVVISLRSNSVLLKYESDELLYYFHGLQPWLHYVPIQRDEDVEIWLDLDEWSPNRLRRIAHEGRRFAEQFLTRAAVTAYMAELLRLYPSCFSLPLANRLSKPASTSRRMAGQRKVLLVAHVEDMGDVEADTDNWVGKASAPRRIEGFAISSNAPNWRDQVTYQALGADGSLSDPAPAGAFCGTKGRQQPIYGFVIHVAAGELCADGLCYEGLFLDGFLSGPLRAGAVCASPAKAELVAMRVFFEDIS